MSRGPFRKNLTVPPQYPRMLKQFEFDEVVRLGIPEDAERKTLWLNLCGPTSKNAGKIYLTWGDEFVFFWDTKFALHKKVALGKLSGHVQMQRDNEAGKDAEISRLEKWQTARNYLNEPENVDPSTPNCDEIESTQEIITDVDFQPLEAEDKKRKVEKVDNLEQKTPKKRKIE
jgi:hypothetical protein